LEPPLRRLITPVGDAPRQEFLFLGRPMITLCPSCWRTIDLDPRTCPHCGANISALDNRTYTEKLIAALQHPDAQTVARVAAILAKTAPESAVAPLVAALRRYWYEPYLAAAIVDALGVLDSADAHALVTEALGHESLIVRAAAAKALQAPRSQTRTSAKG
jgi:hypothetical protein